jgi:pimeloyl-ACP methyl ester carboxylesterase
MLQELKRRDLPPVVTPGTTADNWQQRRREMIEILAREEYGFSPEPPDHVSAETTFLEERAWAGKAEHREIALKFPTPKGEFSFPVDLVIPYSDEKLPLFIYISFTKYPIGKYGPIEEIVDSGYALATFCYKDVTDDKDDDFSSGLAAMYPRENTGSAWGKISMWAWAASRVMDYVQTLDAIDKNRIFVVGHSRLGKTALWCGAQDPRFSAAVSNDSGCSGAAVSRGKEGERIRDIVTRFPHWFCENYRKYQDREEELPFDQHFLIASMAPRPVYVASAVEDLWADPKSEFLSCAAASSAYKLLGGRGLVSENHFPKPGDVFQEGEIGYHLRTGTHFLSRYDWQQFIKYMDRHFK